MDETKIKQTADKIIETHNYDTKVKAAYQSHWIKMAALYSLIAFAYFAIFGLIHKFGSRSAFTGALFVAILIDIPIIFMMLIGIKDKSFKLSDGRKYRNVLGVLLKGVCFFDSMVPVMYIVYYFNYDPATDVCSLPVWKIIVYAPILFVAATALSAFYSMRPPYSDSDKMTVNDMYVLRQTLSLANVDPDKVPMAAIGTDVKSMSVNDWQLLSMQLKLAGFDISKK
ncbi:MAG: hypothetical protein ACI396_07125 [Acutalibacteraceae bacterium]